MKGTWLFGVLFLFALSTSTALAEISTIKKINSHDGGLASPITIEFANGQLISVKVEEDRTQYMLSVALTAATTGKDVEYAWATYGTDTTKWLTRLSIIFNTN